MILEEIAFAVQESVEFADELDVDSAGFAIATPYPGTRLREQALADGGIQSNDWSGYYTTKINYIPPGLQGCDMKGLRRRAEARFCSGSWKRMVARARMHWPSFLLLLPRIVLFKCSLRF